MHIKIDLVLITQIEKYIYRLFILLSSSKFGSIKNFLPGRGAILGFTTGSSRPVRNYKNFNSSKLRTTKAYSYVYYIYFFLFDILKLNLFYFEDILKLI